MLKNTFSVEVYIPNIIHGDILELMDSMRKKSEWISETKTRAANKTISTLLSIWLEDTLFHSKAKYRNDCCLQPKLTHNFTYQSPTTAQSDATKINIDDHVVYNYCPLLKCKVQNIYVKDPFNKLIREKFIEFISPDETTKGRKKNEATLFNILAVSNNQCRSCAGKGKKNLCEACQWISHYTRDCVPPQHETTEVCIK